MKSLFFSLQILIFSCLLLLGAACTSSRHVVDEYKEAVRGQDRTSRRTVLLFLIDGLPLSTLQNELKAGHLPQIKKYFLNKGSLYRARTPFPSLTFPGIGSLLTEKPVDENGLYGNILLQEGEQIQFESPGYYTHLNQMIEGKNIFSRLRAQGLKTVSFDYGFIADTDAHMISHDSEAAFAMAHKKYAFVDRKLIESLRNLLKQTDSQIWPDFIFIHLIGLDLVSHDKGPRSSAAKKYLSFLDQELAGVFQLLQKVERKKEREIVALMTSDHGYDQEIVQTFNLEAVLKRKDDRMEILNEGRFAGLYFPAHWSGGEKAAFMKELLFHPLIEMVAHQELGQVLVQSRSQQATISLGPERVTEDFNQLFYPYFMSNLSRYFRSPGHPDAIVIPKSGVSLKKGGLGQHGGPTPEESFVPLLIRNGNLGNVHQVPALWDILGFL